MFNITKLEREIAGKKYSLETGRLARQANGAVLISCGGSSVITTVCYAASDDDANRDFFPLTVNYFEKFYAVGKFPGGFLKREGKISDRETLIARLTDRPLRPLFPEAFKSEVQIVSTVISADNENTPDILSMIGSSAALSISEIPFNGPVGSVKIGRINGEFIINPSNEQLKESDVEIVVSGTEDAIMMVEGAAKIVPEDVLIEALETAHKFIKEFIGFQKEFISMCAKEKIELTEQKVPNEIIQEIRNFIYDDVKEALFIKEKKLRSNALKNALNSVKEKFSEKIVENPEYGKYIGKVFEDLEYEILRKAILEEGKRCDGRKLDEIRPITCETGVLKQVHGSSLFTRGETQSLGIVTLGSKGDMQAIDSIEGYDTERFMMHYNFPPFSVGEVGRFGPPKRREIGHGFLAKRAVEAILPDEKDFPYAIRLVSEILESNGSSSQASVCSGCLALMDAGVPVKAPVAGIAMGLIKEGDNFKVLSDILGTEDHLGDMDFKIAGTEDGVTAIQMDIKIEGITFEIIRKAVEQANAGRRHILGEMKKAISEPRKELNENAPRFTVMKINTDKIKVLIGPGGKNIKSIVEVSGAKIDINEDGNVTIFSNDKKGLETAIQLINDFTMEPEVGQVFSGKVKRVEKYGAFVEIGGGKEGLLHISEISDSYVKDIEDVINLGDEVEVKIIDIDRMGRIKLSKKG